MGNSIQAGSPPSVPAIKPAPTDSPLARMVQLHAGSPLGNLRITCELAKVSLRVAVAPDEAELMRERAALKDDPESPFADALDEREVDAIRVRRIREEDVPRLVGAVLSLRDALSQVLRVTDAIFATTNEMREQAKVARSTRTLRQRIGHWIAGD